MAEVVAKYKLDVNDAVKNLDKLQKETKSLDNDLDKAGKDGTKSLDNVGKKASGLSSTFKKLGGVIAAAFAVDRIISFGKEAVRVAAKAEGIERAFQKLNRPNLLANLRKATRGTVSDLELMQKAVRANNFQIPLDKLATFFEFATKRSIETGESVDYLVNSIVDGIGRKSTLVLDNLGISASQLQEEIKRTGDFGVAAANIIEQSLAETGEVADTTAIKIAQISTAWANVQKSAGDALIEIGYALADNLGIVNKNQLAIDKYGNTLENLSIPTLSDEINAQKEAVELAKKEYQDFRLVIDDVASRDPELAAKEEARLGNEIRLQKDLLELVIETFNTRIEAARSGMGEDGFIDPSQLDEITASVEKQKVETDDYVRSIAQLNTELKALKEEFNNAEIGGADWVRLIEKAEEKTQELDKALLKAQARLVMFQQAQRGFDPFATEGDEDPSFSLDGLLKETKEIGDDYVEETENVTSIADDLWNRHFNDLMLNAEKSRNQNKENFEESLNEWNTYLQAVSGLGEAFGQIQSAITEGQLKELDTQLQQGLISREEYDIKRRRILKQQAEDQKAVAIFDATINGFAAVVSAYNVDPTGILAGITAAIVAAQVAAIAAQPIPEFAKGVIDLKGKGTETSDDIPAMLSRGESVMTARETRTYKDELLAIRKGGFEQLILTKYVKPMIDKSLFNGFGDIGKSARLNGITANLKDHNILHGLDRLRQSQTQGFQFLAKELKQSQPKRGGYRA